VLWVTTVYLEHMPTRPMPEAQLAPSATLSTRSYTSITLSAVATAHPLPLHAQVPQGATPRTLKVHLCGELTRSVKPGDAVTISGIFLPEPFTGFRAMRAGLVTNTFLEAQAVALDKKSYADIHMTPEQRATIAVREHQW